MEHSVTRQHRFQNTLQSLLLVLTMILLLGLMGWLVGGGLGLVVAVAVCLIVLLFGPRVSPGLVLRMYRAQQIMPQQARGLHLLVQELSNRAALPSPPRLFYIPSPMLNAFAVGSRNASAVALTGGLLKSLSERELIGVLAHEMSHIRHNDMWVMNLADVVSRLTIALSQIGLFLLFISFPLVLFGWVDISLLGIMLLIIAPTVTTMLQLALSRAREFDADLGAAELTGDPQGLASALVKLERYQGGWLERVIMPGRREPDPAVLRTHPPTADRIQRLLSFSGRPAAIPVLPRPVLEFRSLRQRPVLQRRPHWHISGLWY